MAWANVNLETQSVVLYMAVMPRAMSILIPLGCCSGLRGIGGIGKGGRALESVSRGWTQVAGLTFFMPFFDCQNNSKIITILQHCLSTSIA